MGHRLSLGAAMPYIIIVKPNIEATQEQKSLNPDKTDSIMKAYEHR
jgi:hypothetical protein